jgi:hypothetical protein
VALLLVPLKNGPKSFKLHPLRSIEISIAFSKTHRFKRDAESVLEVSLQF